MKIAFIVCLSLCLVIQLFFIATYIYDVRDHQTPKQRRGFITSIVVALIVAMSLSVWISL